MQNFRNYLRYFILWTFFILLVGCGFKPSLGNELPPELKRIYFEAAQPYEQFARDIKQALRVNGVIVVSNSSEKLPTIYLDAPVFNYTNLSVGPSTQARIYDMTYAVDFSIRDSEGKTIVGTKTITARRVLTLPPNEVFDTSTEVGVAKQNLEQEIIIKLLNVLSSKEITQLLHHS
jgi:outer membrane lipopolysaccharide assembly protein LptE/RlpB